MGRYDLSAMTDKTSDGSAVHSPDSSLSEKVQKGTIWVTITTICVRVLNLMSAIILARLMAPKEFGLMAVIMAIIAFSQGTTQTGFESALIQKQEKPEDFFNTTWSFELLRYVILFLIIFLVAPFLAAFFNDPSATNILRVTSIILVFQGLRNIGVVLFRKNLDFKNQFIFEVAPMIVNICVVIPLAFFLKNVWALVLASLVSSIVNCFISYIMHPYRPRIDFNIDRALNLFTFGKWILGESIIGMIREQGITMFVGKFLGMQTLGFFNRATVFSSLILQQLNFIVWKIGYPAYSQLHGHPERFKQVFLKTLQLLTFIGIPIAGGLFVLSHDFVHLFLTDKWLNIVPLMQILSLQAILNIINTPTEITFQASGRPGIGTKISTLGVIILALVVYPLTVNWGITGTVISLFLSVLITSPIVWYIGMKTMRCSFSEFLKPIALPLVNTSIMVLSIFCIKEFISFQIGFISFGILILIGITLYCSITLLFDKFVDYGMYRLIRERIRVWNMV